MHGSRARGDDWQLVDCASHSLGAGRLEGGGAQWTLREASPSPGSLDGGIADPGTIVIETGDAGVQARGMRGAEPIALTLVQAASCY